jgi:hypothetical protein
MGGIASLKVSVAGARIAANSKGLHHIPPELVPPIDPEYTFRFFHNRTMLSVPEEQAFIEIFPQLDQIARFDAAEINRRIGNRWQTSHAKTIDNAIIGFIATHATHRGAGRGCGLP